MPEPEPAGRRHARARARARSPRRTAAPPRRRPPAGAAAARSGARCSSGSFSSLNAFAISMPPTNPSKRSTSPGSERCGFANGDSSIGIVEHERRLDQLRLDVLREQLVDELAPARAGLGVRPRCRLRASPRAASRARRARAMSMPVCSRDRVAQRDPPPRRREVDRLARRRSIVVRAERLAARRARPAPRSSRRRPW